MNFDYSKTCKWLLDKKACDACLGRQFHGMFIGDNALIGKAVRASKTQKEAEALLKSPDKKKPFLDENCPFCHGLFLKTRETADKIFELIQNFDFDSFLVGVRVQKELTLLEEQMWGEIGGEYCEPLKKDLKRQMGLRLEEKSGKSVDFKNPDITLLVDFMKDPPKVSIELNSLFVYGEYSKLVRGIPQTKWFCRDCRGKGCEKCGFTGKMYKESVEELVAGPFLEATGGKTEKFHGEGREDIDAKMLGHRPFVIEVIKPIKRDLDLKKIEKTINEGSKDKVVVRKLRKSSKEEMRLLKTLKHDKTYELLVECENKIDNAKLRELEKEFKGKILSQRTPTRVAHRRADLVRKREVKHIKCEKVSDKSFKAVVRAEAGTYVKELASGDEGRTNPSFADFVGKCKVAKLNVLEVHKREELK